MKRFTLPLGLLGISVMLVGCSSGETAVLDASQKVEEQEHVIVEYINEVASEEGKLQNLFSKTLIEDKELHSMKDSSSTVFKNIDNRTVSLESIEEATSELSDQVEKIKDLKMKDLPEKDIKDFRKKTASIVSSLNDWMDVYEKNLKEERKYFTSLSSDTATYEMLSEGLEAINEQHSESNNKLNSIDKQLSELTSSRLSIDKQLENKDDQK